MSEHPAEAACRLPAAVAEVLISTGGVREFVICAGARNSALLVLLAAVPGLRLWHHFEERSAAFFALGRVLAHGRPAAVVTTSGTAAAELLPAMIEAHYQGLPLVALTADRPAAYRGSGAPQAIEQAGIFGPYPSLAVDVTGPAELPALTDRVRGWERQGPLHVNLCLEEPSAATLPFLRAAGAALSASPGGGPADSDLSCGGGGSTVSGAMPPQLPGEAAGLTLPDAGEFPTPLLLAGDLMPGERAVAVSFARRLGAPVYAEAASGLREAPALRHLLLGGGDQMLRHVPHGSVIRLGGVPSCRFWRDLEDRPEVPVLSFTRSGHSGLARASRVSRFRTDLPPAGCAEDRQEDQHACFRLEPRLASLLAAWPQSEPGMIHLLSRRIPAGAVVFTGNSLPVREWNLCAEPARPLHARALRGANGIEGNLSAFLGLAAGAGTAGGQRTEAWALAGDLTALYDPAALWMLDQLPETRLRIVIVQNGGGKIFSRLPGLRGLTGFERQLMENPHSTDFAGWASQWGLDCLSVRDVRSLDPASLPDRVVIILHPEAGDTETFWSAWAAATASG